jgi:hypothetical protein
MAQRSSELGSGPDSGMEGETTLVSHRDVGLEGEGAEEDGRRGVLRDGAADPPVGEPPIAGSFGERCPDTA